MSKKTRSRPNTVILGVALVAAVALVVIGVRYWRSSQSAQEIALLVEQGRAAQYDQKDSSAAVLPLEQALKLDPLHWEAHFVSSQAKLALNRVGEALDHLEVALNEAPPAEEPMIHLALGQALQRRYTESSQEADFRRARASLLRAADEERFAAPALFALGHLHLNKNHPDQKRALQYLERLIQEHPDFAQVDAARELAGVLRRGLASGP